VHAQLNDVRQSLPEGLQMNIIQDKADFVRHSLKNIKSSLFEAILFVLIIVFLFLRKHLAFICFAAVIYMIHSFRLLIGDESF
jgi:multidrug efflux pump